MSKPRTRVRDGCCAGSISSSCTARSRSCRARFATFRKRHIGSYRLPATLRLRLRNRHRSLPPEDLQFVGPNGRPSRASRSVSCTCTYPCLSRTERQIMKTDAQLKSDVTRELEWDPSINATNVGVAVKNGVVTLTGHLETYSEKFAIERIVQRVEGVQALAVELDVKLGPGHKRSDSEIAEAAESALKWHSEIPKDGIQLRVEKGWITLKGEVDWDFQRRAVADRCRRRCQRYQAEGACHASRYCDPHPRRAGGPCPGRIQAHRCHGERHEGDSARNRSFVGRARGGAGRGMVGARHRERGERSQGGLIPAATGTR